MKKYFAWTLVLVLVLSVFTAFAPVKVKADTSDECLPEVTIGDLIDLAQSGTTAGDNSGHGNHQTRVVRTSHGEYVCYISDKGNGNGINEISVIKVDTANGTAETVFSELKSYDTSQSCIVVDDDENVWMVFVYDDKLKDQFDGRDGFGVHLAAYRIDAATDDVDGYETLATLPAPASGTGYGYSSFFYDSSTNCIYTIGFNGSDKAGDIYWFTFDIDELMWSGYGDAKVDIRHGYPFMIADGKGGAYVICQDDYRADAAGYPEVSNNVGLSNEELEKMKTDTTYQTNGSRWSADYCWDELDFYYIPDMTKSDFYETTIVPKDYSRVKGDQDYRNSYEGRMSNLYPNFQMNNGGDMIIDKDGYMHVVYYKDYIYAASTRKPGENTVMHDVYDLSDPKAPKLVSSIALCELVSEGIDECYWRLYEDTEGNLYYINTDNQFTTNSTMNIYLADGTPTEGYEKVLLASKEFASGVNISVANMRGNSLLDDTVDIILWMKNGDYDFLQVKINNDTEHNFDKTNLIVDKDPTCTEKGSGHYVCTKCKTDSDPVEIDMIPHKLTPVEGKDSTCAEEGNVPYYICDECDAMFEDATGTKPITNPDDVKLPLSKEHKYGEWVITEEATPEKDGTKSRTCPLCGDVETAPVEYIPDTGAPHIVLWFSLLGAALVLAGCACAILIAKKKRA